MYPRINEFVELLHGREISSFLVTNAQFPEAIRYDVRFCIDIHTALLTNIFEVPVVLEGFQRKLWML